MKHRTQSKGFTLIEIIVALVVFAVLSVLGFQGLAAVVDYNDRARDAYDDQLQLHRATSILMQDILHMRPRTIRDRLGGQIRAYTTQDPDYEVAFTRGGLPSVLGNSFGGLQRVAYSVSEEQELLRWTWPSLDAFTEEEPRSQVLMTSVEAIRFLQLNNRNVFEVNWPPLNQSVPLNGLPRMVSVQIEMTDGSVVERLMPGVESANLLVGSSNSGSGSGQEQQNDAEDQ